MRSFSGFLALAIAGGVGSLSAAGQDMNTLPNPNPGLLDHFTTFLTTLVQTSARTYDPMNFDTVNFVDSSQKTFDQDQRNLLVKSHVSQVVQQSSLAIAQTEISVLRVFNSGYKFELNLGQSKQHSQAEKDDVRYGLMARTIKMRPSTLMAGLKSEDSFWSWDHVPKADVDWTIGPYHSNDLKISHEAESNVSDSFLGRFYGAFIPLPPAKPGQPYGARTVLNHSEGFYSLTYDIAPSGPPQSSHEINLPVPKTHETRAFHQINGEGHSVRSGLRNIWKSGNQALHSSYIHNSDYPYVLELRHSGPGTEALIQLQAPNFSSLEYTQVALQVKAHL